MLIIMHTKWVKQWKSAIHLILYFRLSHLISHEWNSDGSVLCFTCFYALFSKIHQKNIAFNVYGFSLGVFMTNAYIPSLRIFLMLFSYSSSKKKLGGGEMKKEKT